MRLGDQPVSTTIQVVCTPQGASETASAVDWPRWWTPGNDRRNLAAENCGSRQFLVQGRLMDDLQPVQQSFATRCPNGGRRWRRPRRAATAVATATSAADSGCGSPISTAADPRRLLPADTRCPSPLLHFPWA